MTYRLSDEDREAVRRMAYAGSYSRDKADRYVATVEAIVAREVAAIDGQRGQWCTAHAAFTTRDGDCPICDLELMEDRAEAAEAKVAAVEALVEEWDRTADECHRLASGPRAGMSDERDLRVAGHVNRKRANNLRAALGEARP